MFNNTGPCIIRRVILAHIKAYSLLNNFYVNCNGILTLGRSGFGQHKNRQTWKLNSYEDILWTVNLASPAIRDILFSSRVLFSMLGFIKYVEKEI
jgi:hypothetical protein